MVAILKIASRLLSCSWLAKRMMLVRAILVGLIVLGWQGSASTRAVGEVVRAVLFYSPSCPHCHKVIEEFLPPIIDRYGAQLEIIGVDTTSPGGGEMFVAAVERFTIPPERQAVPMLIVGETILLGSAEIPDQLPGLIDFYLAQGGIDWPDIPGLRETLATMQPQPTATQPASLTPGKLTETPSGAADVIATTQPSAVTSTPDVDVLVSPAPLGGGLIIPTQGNLGIKERLLRDPAGNALALIVLVGLVVELVLVIHVLCKLPAGLDEPRPPYAILVLSLMGIAVAAYLTYVETAHVQAVCGPVGDCNTVQQSQYARLFGLLPVGVLGLAGYLAIIAAWMVGRFDEYRRARLANLALLAMALFGVVFSIYLTFLEPFVIGATCMWCLSSALITGAIMYFSLAPGKPALSHFMYGAEYGKRKRISRNPIR